MATRVFIGGVPSDCREKDLDRFFGSYGRLRSKSIKNGYAFVEFEDSRDADDAVYELNGRSLLGERVKLEFAKGTPHGRDRDRWGNTIDGRKRIRSPDRPGSRRASWLDKYGPPERTDHRVVVENLSSRVSWQDLKDYMRQAGEVTFADAHKDVRGEGIVEFAKRSHMKTALDKLDGTELNGKRIKLSEESKKRGKRSRSRSRSRSPRGRDRRSRSRSPRGRDRDRRSRSRSPKRARRRSRSPRSAEPIDGRDRDRDRRSSSRGAKKEANDSGAGDNADGDRHKVDSDNEAEAEQRRNGDRDSRPRSASRSRSRSRSRSPSSRADDDSSNRNNDTTRDSDAEGVDDDDDIGPPGDSD